MTGLLSDWYAQACRRVGEVAQGEASSGAGPRRGAADGAREIGDGSVKTGWIVKPVA